MDGMSRIGFVIVWTFIGFMCFLVGAYYCVFYLLLRSGMLGTMREDECGAAWVPAVLCVVSGLGLSFGIWWAASK